MYLMYSICRTHKVIIDSRLCPSVQFAVIAYDDYDEAVY